jgi:hypothetical protein
LQRNYPLVCAELSRQIAARAQTNDLAGQGARARKPWKNAKAISRRERINGDALPSALLVRTAEELVLAALPVRLSERYLTDIPVARRAHRAEQSLQAASGEQRNEREPEGRFYLANR